jgi:hypothetical protein
VTEFLLEGNDRGEACAALQDKYETADPPIYVRAVG